MNIERAILEVIETEKFKEAAKTNATLRVFLSRFRKGNIRNSSAIELLEKYGYVVSVHRKRVHV
jgi:hypothetical protein